jgi:hypothetical protein
MRRRQIANLRKPQMIYVQYGDGPVVSYPAVTPPAQVPMQILEPPKKKHHCRYCDRKIVHGIYAHEKACKAKR